MQSGGAERRPVLAQEQSLSIKVDVLIGPCGGWILSPAKCGGKTRMVENRTPTPPDPFRDSIAVDPRKQIKQEERAKGKVIKWLWSLRESVWNAI